MSAATFDPGHLSRIYDSTAVRAQRRATRELLALRPGHRVLDLGCGAGHLTAELADDVGAAGHVLALDRQPSMLEATLARVSAAGGRCSVLAGEATALPLAAETVDGVVAVQVLEYVPRIEQALAELHRVLRPQGLVVLVDTDWRSCVWHTADRARTDQVLSAWEDHFVHPHLPARMPGLLRAAGFTGEEVHPVPVTETDPSSAAYSLGMADTIAAFVGKRAPDLATAWREDVLARAAEDDYFFSLTRFAAVATR